MTHTLSHHLKELTKQNHQQLEKLVVSQLRTISSPAEYVKILKPFYGYFAALEEKINQHIGPDQLPDFKERRKTESIADDIQLMGGSIPTKAKEPDLPAIHNEAEAFGALYVIEGSTLGGKIIGKMLTKQLNLPDQKGISFFSGYGDESDKMWNVFKEVLNKRFPDDGEQQTIINAANETFLKFKLWIEKSYEKVY